MDPMPDYENVRPTDPSQRAAENTGVCTCRWSLAARFPIVCFLRDAVEPQNQRELEIAMKTTLANSR
jgi:hypothetical protein